MGLESGFIEMENRIIKQGLVEWKKCKWLQPDDLKRQTKEQAEKLKKSLVENGFSSPFFIWENGKSTYILDGHHREKALNELDAEGEKIPSKLPAVWVRAKNQNEAKKLILAYSSEYAKISRAGLENFIDGFDLGELQDMFTIDHIMEIGEKKEPAEYEFSPEIDSEINYIVLLFEKDIDYIQARTLFGIEKRASRYQNGKVHSIGIGRVIDGAEAINKLSQS